MTKPQTMIEREFVATAVEVEGRTVDVRVVPFHEVARVADPPDFTPYDEEWIDGCFDHQLNAANHVIANYQHERGINNVVGHGISLRSVPGDGYHASFKIHDTPNGATALELLRGGALPSVSLEAIAKKSIRTASGVIQRIRADLKGMAFCAQGAFKGAQVLAVRSEDEEPEQTLDAALMPVDIDPELVERLRAKGLRLPDRYMKAHPVNEGTPAAAGTPDEDGTRQPTQNTSSED